MSDRLVEAAERSGKGQSGLRHRDDLAVMVMGELPQVGPPAVRVRGQWDVAPGETSSAVGNSKRVSEL